MWFYSDSDTLADPAFATKWSFIHMGFGVVCFALLSSLFPTMSFATKLLICLVIHTIYEINDLTKSHKLKGGSKWYDNSVINSIGDTIFALVGFFLSYLFIQNPNVYVSTTLLILYFISSVALLNVDKYTR